MSTKIKTDDSYTVLLALCGLPLFLALIIVPIGMLRGYMLSKLWMWYVVGQFSVAPLNIIHAWGLCLIVGFLVPSTITDVDGDNTENTVQRISASILTPVLALFIGWLGTWFL